MQHHDHSAHGHSAHDHAHGHKHPTAPARAMAPALGGSLLRASALARLGGTAIAIAAVWAGVAWAMT